MRALLDVELESVAGGLMIDDPGTGGGGGVSGQVSRDSTGNVNGASFSGSFEGINVNGSAGTETATVSASNGSLSGSISYNHGAIDVGVSGTATFNNVTAVAGYDSNGNATGSITLKAGDSSYSFTNTGGSISHDFGNGYTASTTYNAESNSWSAAFNHSGSIFNCSLGVSLSSSGSLGFGGYCTTSNWDMGL